MSSPLPITAHQLIVRGDDYKIVEARALTWFSPSFPNLAGSTLTMVVGHVDPNIPSIAATPTITWTGTVPAGLETRIAALELPAAKTREAPKGCLDYSLTATLADGDRVTLAIGQLTVEAEPGTATLLPAP